MTDKIIFHCDCNSFFASVELLDNPELKDKPVAVAGDKETRRGVILAKNDIAKKYNITTGEATWQAVKKCPDLVILQPHHNKYKKYCDIVNKIYLDYTDLVEPFGIDESWLDVTTSYKLFAKTPLQLAEIIKYQVKKQTGLTISIGVSFNKVFAKLGSDYKKPDAITVIMKQDVEKIVYPLPVQDLLYVGKNTKLTLNQLGIFTIGDLSKADVTVLSKYLGKAGVQLINYAKGNDTSCVSRYIDKKEAKSIGNSITFKKDLTNKTQVQTAVTALCEKVAARLRKQGVKAKCVQVGIKDTNFNYITRQQTLEKPTCFTDDMIKISLELINKHWSIKKPIRLISITAQNLVTKQDVVQLSLFETQDDDTHKKENLEKAKDNIIKRFGESSLTKASLLNEDLGLSHIKDD